MLQAHLEYVASSIRSGFRPCCDTNLDNNLIGLTRSGSFLKLFKNGYVYLNTQKKAFWVKSTHIFVFFWFALLCLSI